MNTLYIPAQWLGIEPGLNGTSSTLLPFSKWVDSLISSSEWEYKLEAIRGLLRVHVCVEQYKYWNFITVFR